MAATEGGGPRQPQERVCVLHVRRRALKEYQRPDAGLLATYGESRQANVQQPQARRVHVGKYILKSKHTSQPKYGDN